MPRNLLKKRVKKKAQDLEVNKKVPSPARKNLQKNQPKEKVKKVKKKKKRKKFIQL